MVITTNTTREHSQETLGQRITAGQDRHTLPPNGIKDIRVIEHTTSTRYPHPMTAINMLAFPYLIGHLEIAMIKPQQQPALPCTSAYHPPISRTKERMVHLPTKNIKQTIKLPRAHAHRGHPIVMHQSIAAKQAEVQSKREDVLKRRERRRFQYGHDPPDT
jgi:hypothetical protein